MIAASVITACGSDDTVGGGFDSSADCLEGVPRISEGEITAAELAEQCEATVADAQAALDRYRASVTASSVAAEVLETTGTVAETTTAAAATTTTTTSTSLPSPPTTLPAAPPQPSAAGDGADGVIPGLAPVDVYLNLENVGYECADPEDVGSRIVWSCVDPADPLARVEIYGPAATSVSSIDATALASAPQSLEFIATVPFAGADPDAARSWVADAVRNVGATPLETSFGGVPYRVTSLGDAVVLQIGLPPG